MTEVEKLAAYGLAPAIGAEIVRQIDAGTPNGDGRRLMAVGLCEPAAVKIAAAINTESITPMGNAERLMAVGIPPLAAVEIVEYFAS